MRRIRAVGNNLRNVIVNRILAYRPRPGSSRVRIAAIGLKRNRPMRVIYKTTGMTTKRGIIITALNAGLCSNRRYFAVGGSGLHKVRSVNVVYTRSRVNVKGDRRNVVMLPTSTIPNAPTGSCFGVGDRCMLRISVAPGHTSTYSRCNITQSLCTCLVRGNGRTALGHPSMRTFGISGRSVSVTVRMRGARTYPHCTKISVGKMAMGRDPR